MDRQRLFVIVSLVGRVLFSIRRSSVSTSAVLVEKPRVCFPDSLDVNFRLLCSDLIACIFLFLNVFVDWIKVFGDVAGIWKSVVNKRNKDFLIPWDKSLI